MHVVYTSPLSEYVVHNWRKVNGHVARNTERCNGTLCIIQLAYVLAGAKCTGCVQNSVTSTRECCK